LHVLHQPLQAPAEVVASSLELLHQLRGLADQGHAFGLVHGLASLYADGRFSASSSARRLAAPPAGVTVPATRPPAAGDPRQAWPRRAAPAPPADSPASLCPGERHPSCRIARNPACLAQRRSGPVRPSPACARRSRGAAACEAMPCPRVPGDGCLHPGWATPCLSCCGG